MLGGDSEACSVGLRAVRFTSAVGACRLCRVAKAARPRAVGSGLSLAFHRPHARAHPDRAARSEARRPADRQRDLSLPLPACRHADRHAGNLALRDRRRQQGVARRAARLRLAAPHARGRNRPRRRERARARRRLAHRPRPPHRRSRMGTRRHGAAHHRLAAAFRRGAARGGLLLLPPVPKVAGDAGALPAHGRARDAGRRAPAHRAHRARLRIAVAADGADGAPHRRAPALRRARPADPARRRPRVAQSGNGSGASGRPATASLHLFQRGRGPARGADRRGRAHAAGAALLPPSGRHAGALQRHGRDQPRPHRRDPAPRRHRRRAAHPRAAFGLRAADNGRRHDHRRHRPAAAPRPVAPGAGGMPPSSCRPAAATSSSIAASTPMAPTTSGRCRARPPRIRPRRSTTPPRRASPCRTASATSSARR